MPNNDHSLTGLVRARMTEWKVEERKEDRNCGVKDGWKEGREGRTVGRSTERMQG